MAEKQAVKAKAKKAEKAPKSIEPQVFAIVRTCGKQYCVTAGTKISIDTQEGNPGDAITFSDVLMVGTTGGSDVKILAKGEKSLGVRSSSSRSASRAVTRRSRVTARQRPRL